MRQGAEHGASKDTEDGEHFLRSEVAIGNQADEERGNHGTDGESAVGSADLLSTELEDIGEIGSHAHIPGTPDEVLQEHEEGKPGLERGLHNESAQDAG